MLTPSQIRILKMAQREAAIDDTEYRATLQRLAGVATSKDPRIGNTHLDLILAYWEAICWRARDRGILPLPTPKSVFRARHYWATRNQPGHTSRDIYTQATVADQIMEAEEQLLATGQYGPNYCAGILARVKKNSRKKWLREDQINRAYLAALVKTLDATHRNPKPKDTREPIPT